MILENSRFDFDRQEGDKVYFSDSAGGRIILPASLFGNRQGVHEPIYVCADSQPVGVSQKDLLNQLLSADEADK